MNPIIASVTIPPIIQLFLFGGLIIAALLYTVLWIRQHLAVKLLKAVAVIALIAYGLDLGRLIISIALK